SLSPAMAKTSPSRYTWRSSDARSKARYSSSVRNGLCLGMPMAKCSNGRGDLRDRITIFWGRWTVINYGFLSRPAGVRAPWRSPPRPVFRSVIRSGWYGRPSRRGYQDVVAGTSVEDVLPRPADEDVVASAAAESVIARSSDQDVVAVAPVRRELDGAGRQARGLYRVVVCARVDVEPIRRLRAGDVNLG